MSIKAVCFTSPKSDIGVSNEDYTNAFWQKKIVSDNHLNTDLID